ncbi:hypothetical protein VCHA27O13_10200 [Vibrio chagasii]|nr:hypothetical protein VCHA27O13_10200 [Vibrio chagasii]
MQILLFWGKPSQGKPLFIYMKWQRRTAQHFKRYMPLGQ